MAPAAAAAALNTCPHQNARPLPSAPHNVFVHSNDTPNSSKLHAWTNYYQLPIQYAVEIHHNILSPQNPTLAKRHMPPGYKRRFVVIDRVVHSLYADRILTYFNFHHVQLKFVIIEGEELNKRFAAVETIFNQLCEFGLLRREPIIAIGGGCLLDIVGFAASCYRRGVPYIRVPTTLLAIVDASVGVKCGVDWHHPTMGPLKNRMGSFYPPLAAWLDKSFISTQDHRNLVNGMGEIMKLALVRSPELFRLLEQHGTTLISNRFQTNDAVPDRVIELSIQIMLEELGPNLWEHRLERCVDYGHTFSKILEMVANPPVMHGEAVNIDGFLCILLAHRKGWISTQLRNRVFSVMNSMGLPTWDPACDLKVLTKAIADGVEHRHGKLRMPLVKGNIGSYAFVNECSEDDLKDVIAQAQQLHQVVSVKHLPM